LAGIGLFLTGVRFVSAGMKKIANRRLRFMLAKWTQNPLMGAF
jgi:Na+/phosphate symporter